MILHAQSMDDNIPFTEYKKWIDKYIRNNDTREINFQNDVIKRLILLSENYDDANKNNKGDKFIRNMMIKLIMLL